MSSYELKNLIETKFTMKRRAEVFMLMFIIVRVG